MSLVLGAVLGLGILLVVSPFLWSARAGAGVGGTDGRRGGRRAGDLVRDELHLAGLGEVPIVVVVLVAVVVAVVAAAVAHATLALPVMTLAAAVAGFAVVPLVVRARATARRSANQAVWPEVVDHLVSSVRAGMSLPDAVAALGDLGPAATRAPFAEFGAEYRRTGVFEPALDRLKDRLADPVADRILETLRMARDVGGGEIVRVLQALSSYLREDAALRGEVRARQSWVRNAARLGVAAPWLLLLVLATKPETIRAYDSPAGTALLLIGLVVTLIAYRVMIALGAIPGERRWFG
ncbi:type II secretion system protein F [Agromyces protaetiae]|uniref:Type II secretion system protein F n=1 Tax=Agromyces protaetiae TaxID=2509455 RepID=A0A4P6FCP7_9MICO|nr:type II secretion system F family protein [Agromyces protaetiae]QAY73654.1 type II secretion system protein F [Agromyces protaetiae]